jgi:osmotically-inducible protein OsmY
MTTLIQRDDASIELTSTEADVEDWIGGATPAPFDLPVASHEQPRPTPRPDAEIAAEIRGYLRRGLQVEDTAICIQVAAGEVMLTGELARQMHVHRLLERVNGISGVVSVTNRVTARYNDAMVPFAWGFPV